MHVVKAPSTHELFAARASAPPLVILHFIMAVFTLSDYKVSLSHSFSPFSRAALRPWILVWGLYA